jgi:O-antigen/teichoic acid export membrane protein
MLIVSITITVPFLKKYLSIKSINRYDLKDFSIFSLRSIFGGASYYVLNFTDTIIIANFISTTNVTVYVLTMKLCNFTRFIPARILGFAFPSIAQLVIERDFKKLHEITLKFFRLSLRIGFFSGTTILIFNKIFVQNWVGLDKYGGGFLSILFAILCFRESFFVIFFNIIYSTKDIKTITKINFIEAILNIILSIFFLQFWGITGVALGTILSSCIFSTLYGWHKSSKIIQLPILNFLPSINTVLIKSIPTVTVLLIGSQLFLNSFSWVRFVLILIFASITNMFCFEGITLIKYRKLSYKLLIFKIIDEA